MFSGRAPARGRLQARRMRFVRGLRLNMANHPKKAKDPTEVALSAIQEALNISDGSMPEGERGLVHNDRGSAHNDLTTGPISTSPYDEGAFDVRAGAGRQAFEPGEE